MRTRLRSGVADRIDAQAFDVRNPLDIAAVVDTVERDYGRSDMLINYVGFAEDIKLEESLRQLKTNFFGTAAMTICHPRYQCSARNTGFRSPRVGTRGDNYGLAATPPPNMCWRMGSQLRLEMNAGRLKLCCWSREHSTRECGRKGGAKEGRISFVRSAV